MSSPRSKRQWTAGWLLVVLAAVFVWLARRPAPHGSAGPAVQTPAPPVIVEVPSLTMPLSEAEADLALALPAPAAPPLPPAAPPPLAPPLWFDLPTANRSLLGRELDRFYMFVDRYTPGGKLEVWEGGAYGFVRNPRQTDHGTVYTKFHEGIDIAPVQRDAMGEPLDQVLAIADGTVAYATQSARASNYGHYVVVLHPMGNSGVFYSLYAHLKSIAVTAGSPVWRGSPIGQMGYTGAGIDRRRAHVHLEAGLLLSERYDQYTFQAKEAANPHGNFHGSNLIGLDVARFLAAHLSDPEMMPHQFLQQEDIYYKVTVPNRGRELELADRYPWLRQPGPAAASWEISFTGPGVPVAVAPSSQSVTFATVTWVKPSPGYHSWNTRSMLGGSGNTATLTAGGNRYMTLVAGDF
jgi:murein DD-endopeptidase MepM/ murein hydrolase activator NlpD